MSRGVVTWSELVKKEKTTGLLPDEQDLILTMQPIKSIIDMANGFDNPTFISGIESALEQLDRRIRR